MGWYKNCTRLRLWWRGWPFFIVSSNIFSWINSNNYLKWRQEHFIIITFEYYRNRYKDVFLVIICQIWGQWRKKIACSQYLKRTLTKMFTVDHISSCIKSFKRKSSSVNIKKSKLCKAQSWERELIFKWF